MWYSNLEKDLFLHISSINIDTLVPLLYQCVETLSIEVFDCSLSRLRTSVSTSSSSEKRLPLRCFLTDQTDGQIFPTVNMKSILWISFEFIPLATETQNRKQHFVSTPLKHCRHFYYWNQPLNMSMRVCYLGCHEAGLCCYLMIHIQNLLHQLQLFYFHLCPMY
jgi:hypothetical protein